MLPHDTNPVKQGITTRDKAVNKLQYLKFVNDGLSDKQIALKFGVNPKSLARAKRNWNLKKQEIAIKKIVSLAQENTQEVVSLNPQDSLQDTMKRLNQLAIEAKSIEFEDVKKRQEVKDLLYNRAKQILNASNFTSETLVELAKIIMLTKG